ncbi:putative reverse transcriptase domain-containing protein [Tanacetum coccineum]
MPDIKGISPSYCTHKILMEDDYKPIIQPQRRLNPKVQDVVKNKIVKLLDSGLIYPISDSSWVIPIHVVPKKGGMIVVLNDNNELIPFRTVTGWREALISTLNFFVESSFDYQEVYKFFISIQVSLMSATDTEGVKLQFVKEPVEIMDREVKRLKRSRIPIIKVRWNSRRGPEFTWEREDQFRKKYPHLFTKTAPSTTPNLYSAVTQFGGVTRWLRNEPTGLIKTWKDLKTKFLNKYCPPGRTAKKIEEINNFQQESDETLFQAWERFKELLMKCPQHYLTEMQEVILFYNGLDISTRQIFDSRGVIPTKTAEDAKKAIQEMAEYSQKWHNGTSRGRSTETSDGLAAIQAQLNNLGREIKKVNEKVYAAQVGCEQCKGPHYTKDCLQKEEGKTYTQFGGPFQGGGYRATASFEKV